MVNSREGSGSSKVAVVSLEEEGAVGRGEACPTPYFGESVDGVHALIETLLAALAAGEEWDRIHDRTPAGAARNAVDCAVWDLRAKRSGRSRSEEHTSELQSLMRSSYAVFCLKKKTKT